MYISNGNSRLERFAKVSFLPQLEEMGCTYATHEELPCGMSVRDYVDYMMKRYRLFLLFPLPDVNSSSEVKCLMEQLAERILNSPPNNENQQHAIVPVRLSRSEKLLPCFHSLELGAVTLDIREPDSEDNKLQYARIRKRVEEFKREKGREVTSRNRKKSKKQVKDNGPCGAENIRHIELMGTCCAISKKLTSTWIFVVVALLLTIAFFRELMLPWGSAKEADNCNSTNKNSQPSQVTAVTICIVSVVCKMLAGLGCERFLMRYVGSIQEIDLRTVLERSDIQSLRKYLVKKCLLKCSEKDIKPKEVLEILQSYLQSTERTFITCPWIHCGAIVAFSLLVPLRDDHWHRPPESTNVQWVFQVVNVLTTFLVLGFCHNWASLYHIVNKLLVDIIQLYNYSKDEDPPSEGVISLWNKLHSLVEDSITTVVWFNIILAVLQVVVLVLTIPEKSKMEGKVVGALYIINVYLFFSEGLSNCPSRFMKALGLLMDGGVMMMVVIATNLNGYSEVVTFPYGTVVLMVFRLLSYKVYFILFLQDRLIKVSQSGWIYQTETQRSICFRAALKVFTVFWICNFVVDCFPVVALLKNFLDTFYKFSRIFLVIEL